MWDIAEGQKRGNGRIHSTGGFKCWKALPVLSTKLARPSWVTLWLWCLNWKLLSKQGLVPFISLIFSDFERRCKCHSVYSSLRFLCHVKLPRCCIARPFTPDQQVSDLWKHCLRQNNLSHRPPHHLLIRYRERTTLTPAGGKSTFKSIYPSNYWFGIWASPSETETDILDRARLSRTCLQTQYQRERVLYSSRENIRSDMASRNFCILQL